MSLTVPVIYEYMYIFCYPGFLLCQVMTTPAFHHFASNSLMRDSG